MNTESNCYFMPRELFGDPQAGTTGLMAKLNAEEFRIYLAIFVLTEGSDTDDLTTLGKVSDYCGRDFDNKNFEVAWSSLIHKGLAVTYQTSLMGDIFVKLADNFGAVRITIKAYVDNIPEKTKSESVKEPEKVCPVCGEKVWSLDGHHVHPKFAGGSSRKDNITYLCSDCHKKLHKFMIKCAGGKNNLPDDKEFYIVNFNTFVAENLPRD
jgi:hypothetical protein